MVLSRKKLPPPESKEREVHVSIARMTLARKVGNLTRTPGAAGNWRTSSEHARNKSEKPYRSSRPPGTQDG